MRKKTKQILASTTAVGLACTLAAGALLHSSVSVAASVTMMPGIEKIVENTNKDAFRILEIVNDRSEAEIGYYVSGQEPYLKMYRYQVGTDSEGNPVYRTFQTIEEALSVIRTEKERASFMKNAPIPEGGSTGIKEIFGLCGDNALQNPLNWKAYQECYFLPGNDSSDSWERVDFKGDAIRTERVKGFYVGVEAGTGDYTKQAQNFYPVRNDVDNDAAKARYKENIVGFYWNGNASANPYEIAFEAVEDEFGNPVTSLTENQVADAYAQGNYGYFTNVYQPLNAHTDFSTFPGEKEPVIEGMLSAEQVIPEDDFAAPAEFGDGSFAEFGDDVEAILEPFDEVEFASEASAVSELSVTNENPMIYTVEPFVSGEEVFWRYKKYKTLQEVQAGIAAGVIIEDSEGNYELLAAESGDSQKLYYVESRKQIAREEVRNLPSDYYGGVEFNAGENESEIAPYYYQVNKSRTKFSSSFSGSEGVTIEDAGKCPEAYVYTGWYASTVSEDEKYVKAGEGETPTFYASDEEFVLTPNAGDYNFVQDENAETELSVQVDHLYYKGGYINHDWFKRFVFHLSPDEERFHNFDIQVDTLTTAEFEASYKGELAAISKGNAEVAFSDFADSAEEDVFFDDGIQELEVITEEVSEEITDEEAFIDEEAGELIGEVSVVEPMISESFEELAVFEMFEEEEFAESTAFDDGESIEFSDNTDMEAAFSAGEKKTREMSGLQDYDLIYVNGCLTVDAAAAVADAGAACIINQDKVLSEKGAGLREAFRPYINAADGDGHYVKQKVYFFRNTGSAKDGSSDLVNAAFHTNFNPSAGDDSDGNIPEGFEEILEYIESENHFRKATNAENSELLEKEISTARAIEYILNFKYRRKTITDGIRVLELQPGKSSGQIQKADVYKWITGMDYEEPEESEESEEVEAAEAEFISEETVEFASAPMEDGENVPAAGEVTDDLDIEIDTMTTSEFVGHIGDINSEYDIIYLGDDASDLNYFGNFRPSEKVLYYHTGGANSSAAGITDEDGNPVGSVRGSGNDITELQRDKLIDFVKSGSPVVIAGEIYTADKVRVSGELVDTSSYIYDFLETVKDSTNVMRMSDIKEGSDLGFYTGISKPQIVFEETGGMPPSAVGSSDGPSGNYLNSDGMRFQFKIEDSAEGSSVNVSYNCRLYVDMNYDGNFSGAENITDIQVSSSGEVLSLNEMGRYELHTGSDYTVTKLIPVGYEKLIPWKLVVEQNGNTAVRTSKCGYTKRSRTSEKDFVSVLQITPDTGCTWDLSVDAGFQNLFDRVSDFQLEITSVTASEYEAEFAKLGQQYLNQYQMLVLGFGSGDNGNFSKAGTKGITAFAKTGKSVIVSYDNASFSNLGQELRTAVGMDRYGRTDARYADILKASNGLKLGDNGWEELSGSHYDMAYSLGVGKTMTYGETYGFTNGKIQAAVQDGNATIPFTDAVSQVNQGAVTEYPYKINSFFVTAKTHTQPYQLGLEGDSDGDGFSDVTVWYCLGDQGNTDSYYAHSPNDVRNNYYAYSYKNIVYTGIGHDAGIAEMEKKLFVNMLIASYYANAVDLGISFVENPDWEAEELQDVYYALDSIFSNEDSNLITGAISFNMKVEDLNLAGGEMEEDKFRELKLALYTETSGGSPEEGVGAPGVPVTKLTNIDVYPVNAGTPVSKDGEGNMIVNGGNIYTFTIPDSSFLKNSSDEFRNVITLYAKISTEYTRYSESRTAYDTTQINIRKRQLFDMD